MRFLCIDLGDKRTGLAICNEDETISSPLEVVQYKNSRLAEYIIDTAESYQAGGIVFGLPLNMDGTEGDRAKKVRVFTEQVKANTSMAIFFQDERLSSFAAGEKLSRTGLTHKGKKNRLDAIAAAEILQSFLESRKADS